MIRGSLSHPPAARARLFGEKRVFLKSAAGTRFVRIRARDQVLALMGGILLVTWTAAATALVAVDFVEGRTAEDRVAEDRAVYEARVQALAAERDRRHREALAAQDQFASALEELSALQSRVFEAEMTSEESRQEARVLQDRLHRAQAALDATTRDLSIARAAAEGDGTAVAAGSDATLAVLTGALSDMAAERTALSTDLEAAQRAIADLEFSARLQAEKNDRIFAQLEEAVSVTMEPLDRMFAKAGMDPDRLIDTMRNRHSGQGGPLTPIAMSTSGRDDADTTRANNILAHMQELNLYRMAVDKLPMVQPVAGNIRRTSGFGYRRDPIRGGTRLHSGVDWAGPYGTPVMSTAEGTVVFAGWQSGYGRMIKIQHEFGLETRYAHLSRMDVKVGQRVSRGDRIGAMGNSGRSTGTHLHYEVRLGGKATNPMTYITAARDVF